uniref:Uncharacterized protein n=1 Tax=Sphaerodactylus townsendi TaxID=933632 RepID=A0ACB8GF52_9SAUR
MHNRGPPRVLLCSLRATRGLEEWQREEALLAGLYGSANILEGGKRVVPLLLVGQSTVFLCMLLVRVLSVSNIMLVRDCPRCPGVSVEVAVITAVLAKRPRAVLLSAHTGTDISKK